MLYAGICVQDKGAVVVTNEHGDELLTCIVESNEKSKIDDLVHRFHCLEIGLNDRMLVGIVFNPDFKGKILEWRGALADKDIEYFSLSLDAEQNYISECSVVGAHQACEKIGQKLEKFRQCIVTARA